LAGGDQRTDAFAGKAGIVGDDGKVFLPEARRASISRWGRPQRKKPPIMMEAPSGMPATASSGEMGASW
jgi:hypothetical protein